MKISANLFWALSNFASIDETRGVITNLFQRGNQIEAVNGHIGAVVKLLNESSEINQNIQPPSEVFSKGLKDGFYDLDKRVVDRFAAPFPDVAKLMSKHKMFDCLFTIKHENLSGYASLLDAVSYACVTEESTEAMMVYTVLDGNSNDLILYYREDSFQEIARFSVETEFAFTGVVTLGAINAEYLSRMLTLSFFAGCPATFSTDIHRTAKEDPEPWIMHGSTEQYELHAILMPIGVKHTYRPELVHKFYSRFNREVVAA